MAECQRISKLRCFSCNRNRPWSAMLKKLAVLNIRMTDSPVCKEASGIIKCCCLNKKSCNCSMNVSLTYNRNSLFVQKSVCCTWHNSNLTLQLVPALDCSCLAAIFLNQVLHGNLQGCYILKFIIFNTDFHVLSAVLNNLCNLCSFCFCFLHLICQLWHWDWGQLDVEFLKKFTLVAHGGPELVWSCGNLKDSHVAEGFYYITDSHEITKSTLEYWIIQSAVCHVCKWNAESSEDFTCCKKSALCITKTNTVLVWSLIKRSPQKNRYI